MYGISWVKKQIFIFNFNNKSLFKKNIFFFLYKRPGHEDFIQVLEEKLRKPDQKMNTKLELQIKMQYKRQIRNATDPYKRAVYCIIGCCDVTDQHSEVAKTSDDFLWIQLSMIRNDTDNNCDVLTYSNLQSMILEEYGEKYFNASEQPHLYFQVNLI